MALSPPRSSYRASRWMKLGNPPPRAAGGTAVRLSFVSADKIVSCTSGNAMETVLTVDRGSPARHAGMTACSTLKNRRDNPSDFSVQQRPGPFRSQAFYFRFFHCTFTMFPLCVHRFSIARSKAVGAHAALIPRVVRQLPTSRR